MIDQLFSNFGFRALWTPELIVILLIISIIYFYVTGKGRSRFIGSEPVKVWQKILFVLGLIALYFGWGSPLYVAGHMMLTFHMVQMVLSYYVAVPLMILGMPKWFFRSVAYKCKSIPVIGSIGRIIFKPFLAIFVFNGLFSIYHIPLIFDFLMQKNVLHDLYSMMLLAGSFLMWWHMLAPIPSNANLSDLRRIIYIFANGELITPACALIIFASSPLYGVYTDPNIWANTMQYCLPINGVIPFDLFNSGANPFSPLAPRSDQQLAGVVMKVMQEITFGITVAYVFKQWVKKEKQSDGPSISDIPESHLIKN